MKYFISVLLLILSWYTLKCQNIDIKKIDSAINADFDLNNDPGFTIGITQNGDLVHQVQKRMANLENAIPFNKETVFGLASLIKQFTAASKQ